MERNNRIHIDEERLEAYAMNSLPQHDLGPVEEHLLVCATCQDQLAAVERYTQAMRGAANRIRQEEARVPPIPVSLWDRFRGWLRTPAPIWAGAVAMASLILIVGLQLNQRPGPPVDVELQAVRGTTVDTAPSGHPLHLHLDNRGVAEKTAWPVEIVDEIGTRVWIGTGKWTAEGIRADVEQPFAPGVYFVRLTKDGPDPVREYQLTVRQTP